MENKLFLLLYDDDIREWYLQGVFDDNDESWYRINKITFNCEEYKVIWGKLVRDCVSLNKMWVD